LNRRRIELVERLTRGVTDASTMNSRAGGLTWEIPIVPLPFGHPNGGTTPVAWDVAAVDPLAFRAVTLTRSVWPTSASEGV
jgi:hypothetical protein